MIDFVTASKDDSYSLALTRVELDILQSAVSSHDHGGLCQVNLPR